MADHLTWREIRKECQAAGLPIEAWEKQLPKRLVAYIVSHSPGATERYTSDLAFQQRMNHLVALVVACILNRDPLNDPLNADRIEELGDIFRAEAGLDQL